MKSIEPHVKAMELCEAADKLKAVNRDEAQKLYREAFLLERETALSVKKQPSRSVLLKSAIYIAREAGLDREAELLIGLALSEPETSEFIRNELRDLLLSSEQAPITPVDRPLSVCDVGELNKEMAGETRSKLRSFIRQMFKYKVRPDQVKKVIAVDGRIQLIIHSHLSYARKRRGVKPKVSLVSINLSNSVEYELLLMLVGDEATVRDLKLTPAKRTEKCKA